MLSSSQNALAEFGSCTSLPDERTLQSLITTSITAGFTFIVPPMITITNINYVCLVSETFSGTYRILSVVVEYECSGLFLCPSVMPLSQYDFSCNSSGMWEDGLNQHFHRDVADADLTTPNRTECSFCVAPNHPLLAAIALPYDNVTHCVGMSVCNTIQLGLYCSVGEKCQLTHLFDCVIFTWNILLLSHRIYQI